MLQVLFDADGKSHVFDLVKEEASIGRSSDNDIVLNDFSVSRRHAYLRRENGIWYLADNQSTNGIRVNDRQVPKGPVGDSDSAMIGAFQLRFREQVSAQVAAAKRSMDSTSTCIRP